MQDGETLNFLTSLNIPVLGLTTTAKHEVVYIISETMGLVDKFNIIKAVIGAKS